LLYNAGGRFPVKGLRASYAACQNSGKLRIDREGLNQDQVLEWIRNLD
jgi:hypothetical protein